MGLGLRFGHGLKARAESASTKEGLYTVLQLI